MYLFKITLLLFFSLSISAKETCSRLATINYQEVLVDLSNTQKGEGLKFYLDQDKTATKYLNIYQNNSSKKWNNAAIGTIGTLTVLAGISTSDKKNKRSLFISGIAIFTINYLIAKTLQFANEKNLYRAVDEYNKRNLPRIYLRTGKRKEENKVYLQQNWNY